MTALFCRCSGIPPNLAISGFLPGRSVTASKQFRFPCGVSTVDWYLRAMRETRERCLAASVFSMEVFAAHSSRFSFHTSLASAR